MITREQFEAAKMIANIKDNHDMFTVLSYEEYVKIAEEMDRLNSPTGTLGSIPVVCARDVTHDVLINLRGKQQSSSKTGEVLDSEWDDEWYSCPVCKTDKDIIQFQDYEDFEHDVNELDNPEGPAMGHPSEHGG